MKLLLIFILAAGLVTAASGQTNPPSSAAAVPADELLTRTFKLNGDSFIKLAKLQSPMEGEEQFDSFRRYLKDNGVEIAPPSVMFYEDLRGILFVRTTRDNMNQIETLITKINGAS